jgi:PadR family transcriptional regulator, regulatory protein PadR
MRRDPASSSRVRLHAAGANRRRGFREEVARVMLERSVDDDVHGRRLLNEIERGRCPNRRTTGMWSPVDNQHERCHVGNQQENTRIVARTDVQQGTLALMVLKTLERLGSLHGYGIARQIERTSGDLLSVNQGTLYPALLRLEQEGDIGAEWGVSENGRRARYYRLTRAGRRRIEQETRDWARTAAIMARFLTPADA